MAVWLAEHKTRVQLEVFVDPHTAARLNAGKDQLRDNLIIRVRGGEDHTVSFSSGFFGLFLLFIYFIFNFF